MHHHVAAKLRVENPLSGTIAFMGRNKALRLAKQKKLTISACGTKVRFVETEHQKVLAYNAQLEGLRRDSAMTRPR